MSRLREKCERAAVCGATGHLRDANGNWTRCPCLQLEINRSKLGAMFTEKPKTSTPLSKTQDLDLLIQGPLEQIRQHASCVLLERAGKQDSGWITIDAYRLIEIFLGQDVEFETQAAITDTELLILLLGFGDPRNKYLPELLLQTLSRRELIRKPTWVILGTPLEFVMSKYSTEVHERLTRMKRVNVK